MYLLRRQRPYVKAMIISRPRSGTNLLRSLLNSHPRICIHGEVLNFNLFQRRPQWPDRPNYHLNEHEDPVAFLHEHVFPIDPGRFDVVGFKLFPLQLGAIPAFQPRLQRSLERQTDIRIIRLVRENLLDTVLSHILALRDDLYILRERAAAPPFRPVRIVYDDCVRKLKEAESHEAKCDALFPRNERFTFTYAELTERTDETLEHLQRWLGVDPRPLKRMLKLTKQRTRPKREAIENFLELRNRIADEYPQWLRYFDDDPDDMSVITDPRPR